MSMGFTNEEWEELRCKECLRNFISCECYDEEEDEDSN